ncbi:MAG: hypothetical protein JWM21_1213 [Acidobacteria bacterium]|nr:hypothetical protein [Acidobacteriota bacterium]
MAKSKRNIDMEILEGIREIKRGEHGRVINVPSVSAVPESEVPPAQCPTLASARSKQSAIA